MSYSVSPWGKVVAGASRLGDAGPRAHARLPRWLVLFLVSGGGCVGSGIGLPDSAGATGEVPKRFDEIQALIFEPMCAAQCHRGGAAPKGLSLEAGRARPHLVGVASVEAPSYLRVAPGQAEASYFIMKLVPVDSRRVGARMPRNGPPFVTSAQISALKRWINTGAGADWVDDARPDATLADASDTPDANPID